MSSSPSSACEADVFVRVKDNFQHFFVVAFYVLVSPDSRRRTVRFLHQGRGKPGEDHCHGRLLLLQPPPETHHPLLRWALFCIPLASRLIISLIENTVVSKQMSGDGYQTNAKGDGR